MADAVKSFSSNSDGTHDYLRNFNDAQINSGHRMMTPQQQVDMVNNVPDPRPGLKRRQLTNKAFAYKNQDVPGLQGNVPKGYGE